jgi:hypothetical protein
MSKIEAHANRQQFVGDHYEVEGRGEIIAMAATVDVAIQLAKATATAETVRRVTQGGRTVGNVCWRATR